MLIHLALQGAQTFLVWIVWFNVWESKAILFETPLHIIPMVIAIVMTLLWYVDIFKAIKGVTR